jgi:hypothetical protein
MTGEASAATVQDYTPTFQWEYKTSDLSTLQANQAKDALWGKEGEEGVINKKCPKCQNLILGSELHLSVQIHHIYKLGTIGCNFLCNLRLAHPSCNISLGVARAMQGGRGGHPIPIKRENPNENPDATEQIYEIAEYSDQGTSPMKASAHGSPKWFDYLCRRIQVDGITRWEAINTAAHASGLTYQPCLRLYNKNVYQPKKESDPAEKPFMEEKTVSGKKWVQLAPGWKVVPSEVGLLRPTKEVR